MIDHKALVQRVILLCYLTGQEIQGLLVVGDTTLDQGIGVKADIILSGKLALLGEQLTGGLQTAMQVHQARKRRIATSELNEHMLPLIENYPPPATKGKYIKIKYVTQLPTPTPQFAFFVNLPQYIKEPYRRFLENNMRERWDFSGVPMQIYFRQK